MTPHKKEQIEREMKAFASKFIGGQSVFRNYVHAPSSSLEVFLTSSLERIYEAGATAERDFIKKELGKAGRSYSTSRETLAAIEDVLFAIRNRSNS